mmetsp:Transcript_88671/g.251387  ORF Transcript_88671/g.251387 Transcript_88671/m.251387 type:complete len:299 (+) Transcript_88671:54-950(+)
MVRASAVSSPAGLPCPHCRGAARPQSLRSRSTRSWTISSRSTARALFSGNGLVGMQTPTREMKSASSRSTSPSCALAASASCLRPSHCALSCPIIAVSLPIRLLTRRMRFTMEKLSFALALPCIARRILANSSTWISPEPVSRIAQISAVSLGLTCKIWSFCITLSLLCTASSYSSLDSVPLPSLSISMKMFCRSLISASFASRCSTALSSSSSLARAKALLMMTAVTKLRSTMFMIMMLKMNTKMTLAGDFFINGRAISVQRSRSMICSSVMSAFGTSPKYSSARGSPSNTSAFPIM